MNIYDFKVKKRDGKLLDLSTLKGKVILVVNTATGCGFTPQYEELENLYKKYKDKGLEILDFPCDQFGHQAPGTNDEIHEFCTSKYNISKMKSKEAFPTKYIRDNISDDFILDLDNYLSIVNKNGYVCE